MLAKLILVMIGGSVGVGLRFCLCQFFELMNFERLFPWSIFVCNVFGSFLAGFFMGLIFVKMHLNPLWRILLVTGFCGGFTTFSSFSLDTVELLQSGMLGLAMVNMLSMMAACLFATYIGLKI